MRTFLSLAGLVAGLALFGLAAQQAGWLGGGDVGEAVVRVAGPAPGSPATDARSQVETTPADDRPPVASQAPPRTELQGDPAAPPAPVQARPARLGDLEPAEAVVTPVRVRIDAIGADLPVDPVGVEPAGDMEIPDDVRRAGWYRHGPAPGEAGSAVITAHVDSREQGPGPFQRLGELRPGDEVEVVLDDGTVVRFAVIARERVAKADLPVDVVFRRDGDPVLTLITCGGDFDPGARRYADNVVISAAPI